MHANRILVLLLFFIVSCAPKLTPLKKDYAFEKANANGFIYGKATLHVGKCSGLSIGFKDTTGKFFEYHKGWFAVPFLMTKKALFAFELPKGKWKIDRVTAWQGAGSSTAFLDKNIEVESGQGYYLGNLDLKEPGNKVLNAIGYATGNSTNYETENSTRYDADNPNSEMNKAPAVAPNPTEPGKTNTPPKMASTTTTIAHSTAELSFGDSTTQIQDKKKIDDEMKKSFPNFEMESTKPIKFL